MHGNEKHWIQESVSREGDRQGRRTLGQGGLHKEFPMYLLYSFKMCVYMYTANMAICLIFVKARGVQNTILHTFLMFEMLHNKKKSYNQLCFR